MRFGALVLSLFCLTTSVRPQTATAVRLELKKGDRIVFIGNTFAERLVWHGYFEALLSSRFPERELTFRNLGFSGDEALRGTLGTGAGPGTMGQPQEQVWLQLRGLNFGDIFSHIEQQKADVIFACYGMNESFNGAGGLARFEADLRDYFTRVLDLKCGAGKSSPRVVAVSPIPHEKLEGDFPDPRRHNDDLRAYTEVMRKVAASLGLPFIDLFNPVKPLMEDKEASRLTFNGIHLTRYGDWVVAQVMMDQLGFTAVPVRAQVEAGGQDKVRLPDFTLSSLPLPPPPSEARVHPAFANRQPLLAIKDLPLGTYKLRMDGLDVAEGDATAWAKGIRFAPARAATRAQALVAAVDDKNWHFFMRYRPVNGEYIYGRRKEPFGVVSFPPEFELLDKLVAERDGQIHQLAQPVGASKLELMKAEK
jgi:lysophospholipase L1-like esterase